MPIRVIAGTAKGRKLKLVPGDSTRPIMDRAKESLFNILGAGIRGCSLLDLFAGTGSVGIEAFSRGAARALFIDNNRLAIRTIHENLEHTRLTDRAEVLRTDAFAYLQRPKPQKRLSTSMLRHRSIKACGKGFCWRWMLIPRIYSRTAIVVVQIDPSEREDVVLKALRLYDERVYGSTVLWFFEHPAPEEEESKRNNTPS